MIHKPNPDVPATPPGPPTNIILENVLNTSINTTWTPGFLADITIVILSVDHYPTAYDGSDGTIIYSGAGNSVTYSPVLLNTDTAYLTYVSWNPVGYSTPVNEKVGGTAMAGISFGIEQIGSLMVLIGLLIFGFYMCNRMRYWWPIIAGEISVFISLPLFLINSFNSTTGTSFSASLTDPWVIALIIGVLSMILGLMTYKAGLEIDKNGNAVQREKETRTRTEIAQADYKSILANRMGSHNGVRKFKKTNRGL